MGAPDLELAIKKMQHDPEWTNHVLEQADVKGASAKNEHVANRNFSKLFLARWIVLYAFLEAAKKQNNGQLPETIQRDWLILQMSPTHIGPSHIHPAHIHASTPPNPWKTVDPFTNTMWQLTKASSGVLTSLTLQYSSYVHVIIASAPIYIVIDEAQTAGAEYMGAFLGGEEGNVPRPVLRPLVRYLDDEKLGDIHAIVSGTGFSLPLFKKPFASSVGKGSKDTWEVVHSTGDFSNPERLLHYVHRYLPSTFLETKSGEHLSDRIVRWLRGRCVATRVLESQLNHSLQAPVYSPLSGRNIDGQLEQLFTSFST